MATQERRARRLTVALSLAVILVLVLGVGVYLWTGAERERSRERQIQLANRIVDRYAHLLGRAHAAPTQTEEWPELHDAADQLERALEVADDPAIRGRIQRFLDRFAAADNDRQILEALETLTARGANHHDPETLVSMVEGLDDAFRDHGLDPKILGAEEAARRIANSPIAD